MKIHRIFLIAVLTVYGSLALTAHHSVNGTYDSNSPVTLSGIITKSYLRNPHAEIELEVSDANGKTTMWVIQMAGPGRLKQTDFDFKVIDPGQHVTVEAWRARNLEMQKRNYVAGRVLITPEGTRWDIHDIWP